MTRRDKRNTCARYVGYTSALMVMAVGVGKSCGFLAIHDSAIYMTGLMIMITLVLTALETRDRQTDLVVKAWHHAKRNGKAPDSLDMFVQSLNSFPNFMLGVLLIVGNVMLSAVCASAMYLRSGDIVMLVINFSTMVLSTRNLHLLLDYCLLRKRIRKINNGKK